MRLLLAGLWDRRGINMACLLVVLVAVTSCVLGPMYGRASVEHLLDTEIAARAPYTTGLTYDVASLSEQDLPHGTPDAYTPPAPSSLLAMAAAALAGPSVDRYWLPGHPWLLDRGPWFEHNGHTFTQPLYWRRGMCGLAVVSGRCPKVADEALMQATEADALGLKVGDLFPVRVVDRYVRRVAGADQERRRTRTVNFRLAGTYRIEDPTSPSWFDLSRFSGVDNLRPPPPGSAGPPQPLAPALLVAPASMTSQTFLAGADRPMDRSAVDLTTVDDTERVANAFVAAKIQLSNAETLDNLDVASLFDEVRADRTLLTRIMIAALAPLVALALLLLHALVSAAAQVRRPHVALAKLRGHSSGQVFRFAVAEPFLVIVIAAPLGVLLAVATAHLAARVWFVPGIPVTLDTAAWVSLAVVVGSALVAAATAALTVITEPLSAALGGSVRDRPPSRWSLVMQTAVVAIALASVAQLLTSGDQSSQLLALLAPLFIALAVAVCGAWALRGLSRSWLRRTETGGGTPGYLASRRLARRRDVVSLMIPLLLAVSVVTFAASATAVSDDWQRSRASAQVGAGSTFIAESSAGHLLQVTRRVDPDGRYLAAALVDTGGSDTSRRLFVDTTRLATVAAWDPAWSSSSPAELQRRLRPASIAHRLGFAGSRVSVAVRDVALRARADSVAGPSYLWLQYVDDQGEQTDVQLGRLRNGVDATLSADVPRCRSRCLVEQIYLTGQASTVTDVNGRLTLAGVTVDGRAVDWRLADEGAWRAARPFPVSLLDAPVVPEPSQAGLLLRVYLGRLPPGDGPAPPMVSGFARITPSSTPDVVPALATTRTATRSAVGRGSGTAVEYPAGVVVGTAVNGAAVPMRVVERVAALPVLGDEGTLSDLETSLVEFEPAASAAPLVELWAAPGTPASVLDEVRRAGVPLSPQGSLAQTRSELRSSSFSLGLRLFLLVGLATMLLAVFGVFASAVLQSRWRSYEVASLRVVGVPQRSLLRASVLEYVAMLGVAVLLGVLSAYLSLVLVLPSISLGPAEPHAPAVAYDVHWGLVLVVAGTLLLLAVLIAVLVSRRIVRMGRPSTLRWAEQG